MFTLTAVLTVLSVAVLVIAVLVIAFVVIAILVVALHRRDERWANGTARM
jgi:hypothetical protein